MPITRAVPATQASPARVLGTATGRAVPVTPGAVPVVQPQPQPQVQVGLGPAGAGSYGGTYNATYSSGGGPWSLPPFDASGWPTVPMNPTVTPMQQDPMASQQNQETAAFQRMMDLINPEFQRRQGTLEESLANRGIPVGAELYTDQNNILNTAWNQATTQAAQNAVDLGYQRQQDLFNQQLQAQQQGLAQTLGLGQLGLQGRGQLLSEWYQPASLSAALQQAAMGANASVESSRLGANASTANARMAAETQRGLGQREIAMQEAMNQATVAQNTRQQGLAEQLAAAGLTNQAQQQYFNEQMALYQAPYSSLAMLLGAGQYQTPSLNSFLMPGGYNPAAAGGAAVGAAGAATGMYNTGQKAANDALSGFASILNSWPQSNASSNTWPSGSDDPYYFLPSVGGTY